MTFQEDEQAPLALIEVYSNGKSRRNVLTEQWLKDYVENDFRVFIYKFPNLYPRFSSLNRLTNT